MALLYIIFLSFFVCLPVSLSQSLKREEIIFHYNNTYKYNVSYVVDVDKHTEFIMEFAGDEVAYDTPARVTVASDFANRTYPLFITARQQKGVFSWQLPMLVQTPMKLEEFTNISRTLCPHNNLYNEDEETCDVTTVNIPIVHLTSASPLPIRVTIFVETVSNFYIKLNKTTNMTVTPSQPEYYFYPFAQRPNLDLNSQKLKRKQMCKETLDKTERHSLDRYFLQSNAFKTQYSWLSRPKSVIVMIESDDDICAVVSIQNFSCPVFDNERDILYDGYYLTMTRRGGITLTQDTFPHGFYIVFIVKSSDEDCVMGGVSGVNASRTTVRWEGGQATVYNDDARVKKFSFRIIETISYQEYLIAAGVVLGFFLSFYAGFAVLVVYQRIQARRRSDTDTLDSSEERWLVNALSFYAWFAILVVYQRIQARRRSNSDTLDSSEEGRSTPPTVSFEDPTVQTTRRRANIMSGSAESTSRLVGEGDTRPECSSPSDTESELSTVVDPDPDKTMYAGRLCVANLSRCRPRVLQARSKMYLYNILTVAVFYTLPVIQLVVTYQRLLNQSGNQDLCYFNFLCAHPLMVLSDFNHVYSNLGYVILGSLFLFQVYRRHTEHAAMPPPRKALGIPQHFGLLYAMGIALVSEGLLSAAYHVCPNSMNFQFDTSFMYVTSVLCMVKIYQSRHPDINARAHATFGVLALIIFIGLVGVLNANFYFWVAFTVLHLLTCLIMTFQIYYLGRFRLDGGVVYRAARSLARRPLAAITPTHCGRCVMLLIANLANWAIAAYGVAQHSRDFASHLLLVLMSNLFLYTLFYIVMKLLHRETIAWYSWVFIALTYSVWFSSSYFYLDQSTNWALSPAESRQSNRQCSLLQLYDSHDIWHFMSSTAMFFSFNMYLTIDDSLSTVHRDQIAVF